MMLYNPDNVDEEEFAQPLQIPNTDRYVNQHQGFESQTQGGQLVNNNGMMMLSVIKMICNIGFIILFFFYLTNSNQNLFLIIT
jgi:hypothetical protein